GRFARDLYFKWIALELCCHRAAEHQAGAAVIGRRGKDHGRPMAGLLMPCLGIEPEPDDVPCIRDIRPPRAHHASLPAEGPKSASACRFEGVISAIKASRS